MAVDVDNDGENEVVVGDGKLDIITSIYQERVLFYKNIYNRQWSGIDITNTEICGVHAVMAVDVDNDGENEVVVGGDEFPLSYLKHESGTSWFAPQNWNVSFLIDDEIGSEILPCDTSIGARYYCAADFNGDGIIDLASTFKTWTEAAVGIYIGGVGNGDEKIWDKMQSVLQPLGPKGFRTAHGITCTDWNDDGWVDIIVTERNFDEIIYIENLKGEGFAEPQTIELNAQSGLGCEDPTKIVSGDVDGDGLTDLITICRKAAVMAWVPGWSRNSGSNQNITRHSHTTL
jgi:hypothetical protein